MIGPVLGKVSPLVVLAVLFGVTACGGSSSGSAPGSGAPSAPASKAAGTRADADQGTATITIKGSGLGAPQTVNPGEPVHLVNLDGKAYTVTSGTVIKVSVGPNGTATFAAPSVPGSYPLTGGEGQALRGTLNVRGV
jgi:hypothetical protein